MVQDFKVFVNFKTYSQGTGGNAVDLAKVCGQIGQEVGVEITPVVQIADLFRIKEAVKIPVWVQHLDFQPQGEFTGWLNIEAAVEAGASGTLLNHSEHPISPGTIKQVLSRVEKVNPDFQTMLCCKTLGQMERLVKLKPNFLAYEISDIIGSTTSITDYDPKAIKHAAEICNGIPFLVGAGIHKAEDLKKAKDLGASGVLIASAIVLAEDPKSKLKELISGLI